MKTVTGKRLGLAFAMIGAFCTLFVLGIQTGSAASEPGVPDGKQLQFAIFRDGSEIGSHTILFSGDEENMTVDIATNVRVALPLIDIALYKFVHEGHEVWRNGQLVELTSETDDDGTAKAVNVTRSGDHLQVTGSAGVHASPASIVPASLWNPALKKSETLLNTLDGTEMAVSISSLGMESIDRKDDRIDAEHIRISGDLERDLWYTPDGILAGIRFLGDDGSEITYILQ
ncbi:MAG: DUF6134 family protein [Alphaproteobacteria bacterium]